MPSRKKVKKNKVQPCTDANQKVRESAARKQKQQEYERKLQQRIMEERRKQFEEFMRQQAINEAKKNDADPIKPAELPPAGWSGETQEEKVTE